MWWPQTAALSLSFLTDYSIVKCSASVLVTTGSMRLYLQPNQVAQVVQLLQEEEVSRAWRSYKETGRYTRRAGPGSRSQPCSRTAVCSFVRGGTGGALPEPYKGPPAGYRCACYAGAVVPTGSSWWRDEILRGHVVLVHARPHVVRHWCHWLALSFPWPKSKLCTFRTFCMRHCHVLTDMSQTVQELPDALIQVWEEIHQDTIRQLIRSMTRFYQECVSRNTEAIQTTESHYEWQRRNSHKLDPPVITTFYFLNPGYHRANTQYRDKQPFTSHIHTYGLIRVSNMHIWTMGWTCKPDYLEQTNTNTRKTCKLNRSLFVYYLQ